LTPGGRRVTFRSMRATLVWIIALFAALSWVVCWEEWQIVRLRREEMGLLADLRASQGQVGELRDILQLAEKRQRRTAAQVGAIARLQEEAAASRVRRDQESPALGRKDLRRIILSQYSDSLARLNLPPETLARLKDLLVARGEALLDARDAAASEGIADNSAEMAEAANEATADLNRDIADLLGGDAYARLQEASGPQRSVPDVGAPAGSHN